MAQDEQTIDAVAENTTDSVVNVAAQDEQTTDTIVEDTVAESTTDVATESTTDEQTNEAVMNASETRVSNLEDEGVPTSGLDSNSPSSVMMSNSEDSFEDIDLDLELASSKEPESLSSDLLSSNGEVT